MYLGSSFYLNEEVAKLYDLNAKATIFLVERLSDEVAWVISDCATPKEMFTALQKEYGKIDKDEKTEINRVKSITCSGIKVDQFICDLSSGINDLRSMGISTAKFGNPEIIDVLINGLVDPRFKELQSSLIVKASMDQDLTPESIKKTIRIFSSKTQIWRNHSTKNQRTPQDNHNNMSQNENQTIRPTRPVLKCDFCNLGLFNWGGMLELMTSFMTQLWLRLFIRHGSIVTTPHVLWRNYSLYAYAPLTHLNSKND
jgi:hypothetical protein